jgi:PAS domain S-box-containing protein
MKYKLQDLIDMQQFQNLQDRLNEIYSFPSAIIDNEGNILTATAWQDICTQFHRKNEDCARDCLISDRYILSHLHEANPAVSYRCPRGLVDNATPIIIEGIHYGNFFTGQFFLEEPDLEFFKAQAKTFGFDEAAYLEAVKNVPVWSQEQLNSYLFFIKGLILIISESGLKKLKEIEAKTQVEESDERANAILRQMNDGFWITDTSAGHIEDANEAMCRMLGYTREELLNLTVADVEAIDSHEMITDRIQHIIQTGSAQFESRFRRKDKTTFEVEVSVTYLPKQNLFFCFHRDITERKQADEILRQTNETAQAILNAVTESVFLMNADGKIIVVNEMTALRLGKRVDDLVGEEIYKFLDPQVVEFRRKQVDIVCRERKSVRFEDERNGVWFENNIYPIFDADGDVRRVAIYARDITERKRTEEALRESEERFRSLLQDVQFVSVQGYRADGTTQYWNRASERLYGYSAEEAFGRNLLDLIIPPEMRADTAQAIRQMAETGLPMPASELLLMRKDGSRVAVFSSHIIIKIQGRDQELFCIDIDLSERKQAEKLIQAAQHELERLLAESERSRRVLLSLVEDQKEAEEKIRRLNTELEQHVADRTAQLTAANQELEAFSYSVSHDLRAPLRALDGFSAALIADYQDQLDEQGQHYLRRIQDATRRMGQLIEDLHNLARITRREMNLRYVDLSAIASQIADELQAQAPERQFKFDIAPSLTVRADPNLMKIVLENLLRNAIKFTGKREFALIQVGMLEQNGERVFFVRDNGVGFNMDYAGNLFSPFHRLHSMQEFPGTGIGLSIVKRIIARHGGRIWPEAVLDQGATFYFTLS